MGSRPLEHDGVSCRDPELRRVTEERPDGKFPIRKRFAISAAEKNHRDVVEAVAQVTPQSGTIGGDIGDFHTTISRAAFQVKGE